MTMHANNDTRNDGPRPACRVPVQPARQAGGHPARRTVRAIDWGVLTLLGRCQPVRYRRARITPGACPGVSAGGCLLDGRGDGTGSRAAAVARCARCLPGPPARSAARALGGSAAALGGLLRAELGEQLA